MQINAFTISLITATLVSGTLVYFTWKNRPAKGSTQLFFLLLAITEWSLAAVFEAMGTTVFLKTLFSILSYIGITTVPVLFLIFACNYVNLNKYLTKRNIYLLFIIPFITLVIASTNQLHRILWTTITLGNNSLAGIYGIYGHGIWFWVNAAYSYTLMFASILILVVMMLKSRDLYLRQTRVLIFSSVLPLIVNLLYSFSPETILAIDITPVFFTFSGIMLFFAIFYFKMFNLSPVAWDTIIKRLDDGIILFNKQGQLVDINESSQRILGLDKIKIGTDKKILLDKYPEIYLFCNSCRSCK
jgi:PAS domain-containing protein